MKIERYICTNEEGEEVVRMDTGVLLKLEKDDMVVSRKNRDKFKRLKATPTTKLNYSNFLIFNVEAQPFLEDVLSTKEIAYLQAISAYVKPTSCVLKKGNNDILWAKDVAKIIDLSLPRTYTFLKKLRKNYIIMTGKLGEGECYILNPYIYKRGSTVNATLVDLFYGKI